MADTRYRYTRAIRLRRADRYCTACSTVLQCSLHTTCMHAPPIHYSNCAPLRATLFRVIKMAAKDQNSKALNHSWFDCFSFFLSFFFVCLHLQLYSHLKKMAVMNLETAQKLSPSKLYSRY